MERDVRNKAKTVHQMVSELDQKKVSFSSSATQYVSHSASLCKQEGQPVRMAQPAS